MSHKSLSGTLVYPYPGIKDLNGSSPSPESFPKTSLYPGHCREIQDLCLLHSSFQSVIENWFSGSSSSCNPRNYFFLVRKYVMLLSC